MENIFTEKYLQKVDSQTLLFVNVEKMSFSLENILNEADGHASIPRKSFLSLGSSVTKLLDYLLNIWALETLKNYPKAYNICQGKLKLYPNLHELFQKGQSFESCAKGAKFCQIWSHCSSSHV